MWFAWHLPAGDGQDSPPRPGLADALSKALEKTMEKENNDIPKSKLGSPSISLFITSSWAGCMQGEGWGGWRKQMAS